MDLAVGLEGCLAEVAFLAFAWTFMGIAPWLIDFGLWDAGHLPGVVNRATVRKVRLINQTDMNLVSYNGEKAAIWLVLLRL